MSQRQGSAGTETHEIDLSAPDVSEPNGVPAAVVGTSVKGPAFVPTTLGTFDFYKLKFGPSDGKKFGPLAVKEWLESANSAVFVRVLGAGNGKNRNVDGSVTNGGFVVGEQQPDTIDGTLLANPYANDGSIPDPDSALLGEEMTIFLGA